MAYDLVARNNDVSDIRIGGFTWPIMLKQLGIGYLIGYGGSISLCGYSYIPRKGASPCSNDGFPVTAKEAKAMAMLADGYLIEQRFLRKQWDELSEEQKEKHRELKKEYPNSYTIPDNEDYVKKVIEFMEFAEKSGGFKIH